MFKKENIIAAAAALFILSAVVTACGGAAGSQKLTISSKEFTEQLLLGNMYALLLDDAGFDTEFKSLGGSNENHQAILNDEIDIYPEYTGTALLTFLEEPYDPSMSPEDVYRKVSSEYAEQFNLVWGEQTEFNNTYCIAMPEDKAQELGVSTLSELSTKTNGLVFGTVQEFMERDDGLPGMQQMYGGFQFDEVIALDPGLKYAGIREGDIDVTTCFGTDGQISAYNLRVLEDDKNFWPPYPVAPVIRQEILDEYPEVKEVLDQLAPILDGETMSSLNWEVDGNGREVDEVAREFLLENGLISTE